MSKTEDKNSAISNLATKAALNIAENEIPDISNLLK